MKGARCGRTVPNQLTFQDKNSEVPRAFIQQTYHVESAHGWVQQ